MKYFLKKIVRNLSIATGIPIGISRKMDYKTLSRYMLRINAMQDLNSILQEASQCLKDILSYRLFAFAIQDDEKLDVWIDPSIHKKPFEKIIEKDFDKRNSTRRFHHFKENQDQRPVVTVTFHSADLISYVLMDGKYFAKLYLLPDGKILHHHNEIINIIVKTLGISLTNHMNIKSLQNAAAFDPLTNCYNRREFERLIEHNIANAKRYGRELSVIMLDLDHFKQVNDQYGHLAGDLVLRQVSEVILEKIRKGDYLARYGGEEFVLVLPDTKRTRAMELAERLKQVIRQMDTETSDGDMIKVTASFGVASLRHDSNRVTLLEEADTMLYQAKAAGRDQVMPQMKLLHTLSQNDTQNP